MSTQLAKQEPNAALTLNRDQIELVKRTVAQGATDDELKIPASFSTKTREQGWTR